ncbi:hypothetical protein BROUX41_005005 [Berkeleyomyces rouxiae]|uniref:uncharacterized protein n=1 Tax=Berkeleyomyces rouxiae TaxID=2035830 RepID=UPI003B7A5DBF
MVPLWILASILFYTQVATATVRTMLDLGLYVEPQEFDWLRVTSDGGFDAEILVEKDQGYMVLSKLKNPERFSSAEALLSFWRYQTKKEYSSLKHIRFIDIKNRRVNALLDAVWYDETIDARVTNVIEPYIVQRPNEGETNWRWDSLSGTLYALIGRDICMGFDETIGFYLSSLSYGREGRDGRWLGVTFGSVDDESKTGFS